MNTTLAEGIELAKEVNEKVKAAVLQRLRVHTQERFLLLWLSQQDVNM